jgi:hypothetical protein
MAKFLKGNELNSELEKIFETATEKLILISPYIKLHERYASVLKVKRDDPSFEITVVFGKNEDDFSRSMKLEDFVFFKDFPNIQIRYEKRLHAKYYANESSAILSSMNLYSFSQDNNIEAGIMTTATILGNLASNFVGNVTGEDTFDRQALSYFMRVVDQSELLFKKTPRFESTMLGLSKKYKESIIEVDSLSDFFSDRLQPASKKRFEKKEIPAIEKENTSQEIKTGYCIRTGMRIPFDIKQPMCDEAFKNWKKYGNKDFKEKFCHFSGESSNGETTYAKPILPRYWKKAEQEFGPLKK